MLSPSEVGFDLSLYAQIWLEERMRLTRSLAREVAQKPTAKAVHDVRVACRRLREAIEFFRGVPEVPGLSDVDRAARSMARSVSRLRELDVAKKRLAQVTWAQGAADTEAQERLLRGLKKRRKKATKKHAAKIEKRATELASAIDDHLPLCDKPRPVEPDHAREGHLLAFVEARVSEKRALVERLFDDLRSGRGSRGSKAKAERLHAVRVAIKHWRYAGEIARAAMPRVLYRPMASRLRALQEVGGKGQDLSDLERIVADEIERRGIGSRAAQRLLLAIRRSRHDAASEFVDALGSRLPAPQAASAG